MSSGSNAYEIGYKKPPTATRFQKGKSGNPSGRPKRRAPQKDTGKILQHLDNEEIVITVNGKRKRMRRGEVLFQQLFTKAIKGNLSSARIIAKKAAEYFSPEAQEASEVRFEVLPDEELPPKNAAGPKENPYRNPPKDTQFKMGRSSNPKGRPKQDRRELSAAYLFRKVAWEQVPIELEGCQYMVPRWQLYLRQIYNMALNGDHSAVRLLNQLRRQFPGDLLPGDPITFLIYKSDENL